MATAAKHPTPITALTRQDFTDARTRADRLIAAYQAVAHQVPHLGRTTPTHPIQDGIIAALTYIPRRAQGPAR